MITEEAPRVRRERSVGNAVVLALVIQIAGVALGYTLQFLLARWLGARGYGVYASAVAWSTALSVIASAGLTMSALRFIPEYASRAEWGQVRGFVRFGYALSLGLSIAIAVICAVLLVVWRGRLPAAATAILLPCCWLVPLMTLSAVQSQLCRGFKWIVTAFVFPMIVQPILTGLFAFAVVRSHALTSTSASAAIGVAIGIAVVLQALIFTKRRPVEARRSACAYDGRMWLRITTPLWIICGFDIILNQLDILMVTLRRGANAAGFYNAASITSAFVQLGLLSVNSIAAPTYASLYAEGRIADMQRLASRVSHWITWPAVVVVTILTVFGRPIPDTFGPGFSSAYASTVILGFGQLVNCGAGTVGYLLGLTGHQDQSARVLGWSALANIAMNLAGITFFGLTGAAIGTAISMALWNLWLYRLVVRHVGVRPSIIDALLRSVPIK
jgi:O-antigen/teichoic acid export membrane protein